eukprot:363880-Chlamydomonas_euryale.AAC.5
MLVESPYLQALGVRGCADDVRAMREGLPVPLNKRARAASEAPQMTAPAAAGAPVDSCRATLAACRLPGRLACNHSSHHHQANPMPRATDRSELRARRLT